ncbi:MAG: EF-hand domain-containing protein [Gammaproteobacteria bacterium]|jgi:Ca2+-binding EF-hand superfamily protein
MMNQSTVFFAAIACVVGVAGCAGQDTVEIGDPTVPGPEASIHYNTVYDAFTEHDTDGDGYLDEHEFTQLQTDPNIVAMRKSIPELVTEGPMLFTEVDENGDGRISDTELMVIAQPLLPKRRTGH